jgi:hypothetical protein
VKSHLKVCRGPKPTICPNCGVNKKFPYKLQRHLKSCLPATLNPADQCLSAASESLTLNYEKFENDPHHAKVRVDPVDLALKNRNWF